MQFMGMWKLKDQQDPAYDACVCAALQHLAAKHGTPALRNRNARLLLRSISLPDNAPLTLRFLAGCKAADPTKASKAGEQAAVLSSLVNL